MQPETAPVAGQRRPLQHLEVAVGVAEGGDGAPADVRVDTDRLAGLVVDEVHRRQAEKQRHPVAHLEARLDARSHHLLGRNAVHPLGPRPHELDAAARGDEGLKAPRAQQGQKLEHRLVDELRVRALEAGMARRGQRQLVVLYHLLAQFVLVCHLDLHALALQVLVQAREHDVHDLQHILLGEGLEDDDLIHPVEELGPESPLQGLARPPLSLTEVTPSLG